MRVAPALQTIFTVYELIIHPLFDALLRYSYPLENILWMKMTNVTHRLKIQRYEDSFVNEKLIYILFFFFFLVYESLRGDDVIWKIIMLAVKFE